MSKLTGSSTFFIGKLEFPGKCFTLNLIRFSFLLNSHFILSPETGIEGSLQRKLLYDKIV